jgi:hypothetical protein
LARAPGQVPLLPETRDSPDSPDSDSPPAAESESAVPVGKATAPTHNEMLSTAVLAFVAAVSATSAWEEVGISPPETLFTWRLHLRTTQQQRDSLTAALYAVSDPASPSYGKHLTRDAADDLVRPTASVKQQVDSFLASSCVESYAFSRGEDWATAVASAACGHALFGVRLQHYREPTTGRSHHRCSGPPSVPAALASSVAAVAPCSRRPDLARALRVRAVGAGAPGTTPATIRAAYGIGAVEGTGVARIQVAGFLEEYAEYSDLQSFFGQFYKKGLGRRFAVVGPNKGQAGVEASLDVQYVMSIGANSEYAGRFPLRPCIIPSTPQTPRTHWHPPTPPQPIQPSGTLTRAVGPTHLTMSPTLPGC